MTAKTQIEKAMTIMITQRRETLMREIIMVITVLILTTRRDTPQMIKRRRNIEMREMKRWLLRGITLKNKRSLEIEFSKIYSRSLTPPIKLKTKDIITLPSKKATMMMMLMKCLNDCDFIHRFS